VRSTAATSSRHPMLRPIVARLRNSSVPMRVWSGCGVAYVYPCAGSLADSLSGSCSYMRRWSRIFSSLHAGGKRWMRRAVHRDRSGLGAVMDTRLLGPAAFALVMNQRPIPPRAVGTVRDSCAAAPTKRRER
jgi:hypothetical protein